MADSFHSVVVIGSGIAGLYCAQLLRERVPDLLVLEAQDRVGGRIKQVEGLTPWPMQAGPEFVHGSNSVFFELLTRMGVKCEEREWPDWWWFPKEKKLLPSSQAGEDVAKVHEIMTTCDHEPYPPAGKDISAVDWMKAKGANDKMLAVAEACYANDFSCSLRQLGVREMQEENKRWDCGETYLVMDRSMGEVARHLSQGLNIRTHCPVERIEYSPNGAILHCRGGRRVACKKVVITVSVKVLQDGLISFQPALPEAKQDAVRRIKMGNVVKIMLTFKRQFWPKEMYDVLCADAFVPEFWMLRYPVDPANAQQHPQLYPNCIVGFIAGEKADAVSKMAPADAVARFLQQLDEAFATEGDKTPASSSLAHVRIVDWSQEPYVRAAYTYPTLGAEMGDRDALGAPVMGTLFFAGEATHTGMNPCLQGAMETGERAALQVTAALDNPLPEHSKL